MKHLALILGSLVLSALASAPALADTYTYTYTGNPFTTLSARDAGGTIPNLYTTSDFVSGSFTVSSLLAPDLNLAPISIDSASFTDGVQTMSTAAGTAQSTTVDISTDASGNITSWVVILQNGESDISTGDALVYDDILNVWSEAIGDSSTYLDVNPYGGWKNYSASNSTAGTWTMTENGAVAAAAPEPSSLLLLGTSSIAAVALLRRRITCC